MDYDMDITISVNVPYSFISCSQCTWVPIGECIRDYSKLPRVHSTSGLLVTLALYRSCSYPHADHLRAVLTSCSKGKVCVNFVKSLR